jgi:DNA repair exonuclease SbcCD ATPase subunit
VNIDNFRDEYNQRRGQQQTIQKELSTKETTAKDLSEELLDLEECRLIVQDVSKQAQDRLAKTLNNIVSTALDTVFENPYQFDIRIESKSNVIQATPILVRNGEDFDIQADVGYGVVNVIALALRVALLSLQKVKNNVLIIDEPFKEINDPTQMEGACRLLQVMSQQLKLQFIIVTGEDSVRQVADKLFQVKKVGDVSVTTEVEKEDEVVEEMV